MSPSEHLWLVVRFDCSVTRSLAPVTQAITMVSILVALGGVIIFYYIRERKEDQTEQKKTEHLFAF